MFVVVVFRPFGNANDYVIGEIFQTLIIKGAQYLLNIHEVMVAICFFFPAGVQDEGVTKTI